MEDLLEFAQQLQGWHEAKVSNLEGVIANVKEGVFLRLGDDGDEVELNLEQARWFKGGLQVALQEFEKLPFTLNKNSDDDIE